MIMSHCVNRKSRFIRSLAGILCILMLLGMLSACGTDATDPTSGTAFPTTQPTPTDQPTVPAPTDPAPTDPAPTAPAPTEPAPTAPAPTEPAPTDPAPTEPAPTEPAPTEPAPTEPAPTEPAPTEPAPTEPPAPDYSWLTGSWSCVKRNAYEDGIVTLGILTIHLNADGTGYLEDNSYTNFDIINGCFVDHWIQPGDLAFTSESISYRVEGNKLAITFQYHEYVSYEPFTVYFPLPEPGNNMITFADPSGNIQDSALGGSIPGNSFVKGPISLEDLCAKLGVDYSVPPVQENPAEEIPQWLAGSWETAWRDDANQGGQPYLITSGYFFRTDGTGYTLGCEYWAWDMENNRPMDSWVTVPMGYPSTYFTYSVAGDQLTIVYLRDDFEEYQPPYPTQVMTLMQNPDGSITLSPDGRTFIHNVSAPEDLCAILGVDYRLPQIEESPYAQLLQQDSWHITVRNDLGKGLTELRTYSIEFNDNGSGYYILSSHLMNRSRGELSSAWNKQSVNTRDYISFQYTLSGDVITITAKDGKRTDYKIEIVDQIMELTNKANNQILRFAAGKRFNYVDKLCELIGVYYDCPSLMYAEKIVGTMYTAWRDDAANGYPTRYQATVQFNADGTGTYTRQGYIAWDTAQNAPLDHWVEVPELGQICNFTYAVNRGKLDIQCSCGNPGCCSGSYIQYYYGTQCIYMYAQDGTKGLPFHQLIQTEQQLSQEMICTILGVDYALSANPAVTKDALLGTWKNAQRQYETNIAVHSYVFQNDGTGEKGYEDWRCTNDRGYIQDHWEPGTSSTPAPCEYTLRGNTLTIKARIYRDYDSIYQYRVAILSDGTLLLIPEFDDPIHFVKTNSASTLEQICDALHVDHTIPQ